MRVIWQCEIDPYARRVLAKHWPDIPCYEDVRAIDGSVERPDLICGGFPCQDISVAGKRVGIHGERSGLWSQFSRIIRVLRPLYVVVENVPRLLAAGLGRVLGDLASGGFDAEWECLSAAAFGRPQARDRMFIVAYRDGLGREASCRIFDRDAGRRVREQVGVVGRLSRLERGRSGRIWAVPDSGIHGMAHGIPGELDRLRTVGNAVCPQIGEWIGRRVLESLTP